MMIRTTEGLCDAKAKVFETDDAKIASAFLKQSSKTAGFSITYAINKETKTVVKIFKKGKPCARDLKPLINQGFRFWMYSWIWEGKKFEIDGEIVTLSFVHDLTK